MHLHAQEQGVQEANQQEAGRQGAMQRNPAAAPEGRRRTYLPRLVGQPPGHVLRFTLLLGLLTGAGDYLTGPYIHFPVLFLLPVILAAWSRGWRLGAGMACLLMLLRLGLEWHWDHLTPWTMSEALANALVYLAVLGIIARLTASAARQQQALQNEVHRLRGIVPICMWCKKIRDDRGDWQALEAYLTCHSEAQFSHGLCPACMQEHYADYVTRASEAQVT